MEVKFRRMFFGGPAQRRYRAGRWYEVEEGAKWLPKDVEVKPVAPAATTKEAAAPASAKPSTPALKV